MKIQTNLFYFMLPPTKIILFFTLVYCSLFSFAQNNALTFDGANQHVVVPHDASLDITGDATIEFWVNWGGFDEGAHTILSKSADASTHNFLIEIEPEGGLIVEGLSPYATSIIVPELEWSHFAIVQSESSFLIYKNGVLEETIPGTWGSTNIGDFLIGSDFDIFSALDGSLDEIRIWNYARSAIEIANTIEIELTGSESGLVAYYNFNGVTGTLLSDLSPNGLDGTLTNMDGSEWVSSGSLIIPPSATLSALISDPSDESPVTITITFNEQVTPLDLFDFNLTNANVSNIQTLDNIVFTADITPAFDGAVSVEVLAAAVVDLSGNPNPVSNTLSWNYQSALDYMVAPISFSYETLTSPTTISAGVTQDDGVSSAIPIGFEFEFFGISYFEVFLTSNGFISFIDNAGQSGAFSAELLPDSDGSSVPGEGEGSIANGIIAAYWSDLDGSDLSPDAFKIETLGTSPNQIFVIEYEDVPNLNDENKLVSFQIKLYEGSNEIEIHCLSCEATGDGQSYTQGIEDEFGVKYATLAGRNQTNFSLYNDAARFTPVQPVIAYQATSVSVNGFTANWEAINATAVKIDIDDNADFMSPFATNISVSNPLDNIFYVSQDLSSYTNQKLYYRFYFENGAFTSEYSNVVEFMVTPGNALDFDGVDDVVTVSTSTDFEFATGTFEAWIKPSTYSANKVIAGVRSADTQTRWSVHVNEGTDQIGLWNGAAFYTVSATINDGTWYHIAVVFGVSDAEVFVNGISVGFFGGTLAATTGQPFLIGSPGSTNASEFFDGEIDEISVWNTIRTQSEIASSQFSTLTGNEAGLVAYYRVDDGEAGISNIGITAPEVMDLAGNGNDGTMNGFAKTGSSSNWVASTAMSSATAPATPDSLIVYKASDTELLLEWNDQANDETGYMVERSDDGIGGWSTVASLSPNSNFYIYDASVNPASYFRVSATNANGTATSETEFGSMASHPGYAMNFDGVDDYVEIANSTALSSTFTIEAWIKTAGNTGQVIYSDLGIMEGFEFGLNSSNQLYYIAEDAGNPTPVTSTATIPLNEWTHVAVAIDGTSASFFNDGKTLSPSASPIVSSPNGANDRIGASTSGGSHFIGQIDEVRLWENFAKTDFSDRFEALEGDESGLVAYYPFEENSLGATVYDRSVNTNNGTQSGLPTYVASGATAPSDLVTQDNVFQIQLQWVDNTENETGFTIERSITSNFGAIDFSTSVAADVTSFSDNNSLSPEADYFYRVRAELPGPTPSAYSYVKYAQTKADPGSAYSFDGVDNYVQTPEISHEMAFTYEFWMNTTALSQPIWSVEGVTNVIDVTIDEGGVLAIYIDVAEGARSENFIGTTTVGDGAWHHVVIVKNYADMEVYVDGIYESPASLTNNIQPSDQISGKIQLGASSGFFDYFDGSIDEVRIWNTARTAQEILDHKDRELDGNEFGLVAYYQFDEKAGTTLYDRSVNVNNGTNNGATIVASSGAMDTGITPDTPTGFTARKFSDTQIELNWTDGANEQGYRIFRADDYGFTTNLTQVDEVAADVTSFKDEVGLNKGYFYILESFNGVNTETVITPEFGTTESFSGYALDFDGAGDYVDMGSALDLRLLGHLRMNFGLTL